VEKEGTKNCSGNRFNRTAISHIAKNKTIGIIPHIGLIFLKIFII
jgi:hypothetical protein